MKELSTNEVARMMGSLGIELIDIREEFEIQSGTIPGAKHIPLGQIEQCLTEFQKEKKYIIICRSGSRSAAVVNFLNAQGLNAYNMVGGIMDWSGSLDKFNS